MLTQMINDCEQQDNGLTEHGSYRPDSNTFRQVITAWTKSGCADMAAKNGSRIINQMITEFPMLSPDASTFNALMTLYLQLGRRKTALALFEVLLSMRLIIIKLIVYHTFLRVVVCIGTKATVLPINAAYKRTRTAVDFILLLSILSMGNTTYLL